MGAKIIVLPWQRSYYNLRTRQDRVPTYAQRLQVSDRLSQANYASPAVVVECAGSTPRLQDGHSYPLLIRSIFLYFNTFTASAAKDILSAAPNRQNKTE